MARPPDRGRRAFLLWGLLALPAGGALAAFAGSEYVEAREAMVREQIEARGVRDARVLAAMRRVPRHLFVPPEAREFAYEDHPLVIGHGQTISQPYIVAYMTELLGLKGGEKVLEVGTGSGYQAAVLAELVPAVYTIEIIPALAEGARRDLARAHYRHVEVRTGNGWEGWPERAPFDAIMVTAAPREVPHPLVEQLKEGGRLVIPLGEAAKGQMLVRFTKKNGRLIREEVLPVRFVPFLEERESGQAPTKRPRKTK